MTKQGEPIPGYYDDPPRARYWSESKREWLWVDEMAYPHLVNAHAKEQRKLAEGLGDQAVLGVLEAEIALRDEERAKEERARQMNPTPEPPPMDEGMA